MYYYVTMQAHLIAKLDTSTSLVLPAKTTQAAPTSKPAMSDVST